LLELRDRESFSTAGNDHFALISEPMTKVSRFNSSDINTAMIVISVGLKSGDNKATVLPLDTRIIARVSLIVTNRSTGLGNLLIYVKNPCTGADLWW
jgi:hypothetical protein